MYEKHEFRVPVRALAFVASARDTADVDYQDGAFYAGAGSASAPSWSFAGDTDTGFYRSAANTLGVAVAGALDFSFSANSFNVLTGSGVLFADSAPLNIGDANDIVMAWDGTRFNVTQATTNSEIRWGVSGAGIDQKWYGDTAGRDLTWDQSADSLVFEDNAKLVIGTGLDDSVLHDATDTIWTHATGNLLFDNTSATGSTLFDLGTDTSATSMAVRSNSGTAVLTVRGDTTATALGLRTASVTAAAITGATVLTLSDAGGVFSVSQAAAYDIDLPSPATGPGCSYMFYLTGAAANNVTITVAGAAATFVGTIVNDVTSVVPATGSTLTFASGASALGDTIEIISISTTLYLVRAVSSAAGGITIA